MKYAVISDIHANVEALTKAFQLIDAENVDEIICLGDLVGYGPNPNECAELVRSRCSIVILGNHDAAALDPSQAYDFNPVARKALLWTVRQLSAESRAFLSSLPLLARRENILFVHSSPDNPPAWDYVISAADAASAILHFKEKLCFIGHTHIPGIFSGNAKVKSISSDAQYLVNVGSVGQPRDGNPMLSFGIFNSTTWEYKHTRSAYEIQKTTGKILAAGLPEELGFRLMCGL
jgi:predicted phosphodiesterase